MITKYGILTSQLPNKRMAMKNSHNKSNTRLYSIWINMKGRCLNKNNTSYYRYGGNGITVCKDWAENFSSFEQWALSSGYKDILTIDRIDPTKGYNQENCRWETALVQAANTKCIHSTNKSGYRGVSWAKDSKKWEVSIGVSKKTIKIGFYTNLLEAAKAYDSYIIKNSLPHTINNVLSDGEYVNSNIGQILTSVNTSGYRGVSSPKRISHLKKPWTASLQMDNKKVWSGYFTTALEAAVAREIYILENSLPHKLNFSSSQLEVMQLNLKEHT